MLLLNVFSSVIFAHKLGWEKVFSVLLGVGRLAFIVDIIVESTCRFKGQGHCKSIHVLLTDHLYSKINHF